MANTSRLDALDVLRGLAVAGMILVNSPGDWLHVYTPLEHAAWNGWTLADMVFPTFLFSVGVSLGLASPAYGTGGERKAFCIRVLRRTALLILIGLALEVIGKLVVLMGFQVGDPGLDHLRLPGVLQRIALCYLLAVVAIVVTGRREMGRIRIDPWWIAAIVGVILVVYWLLMTFVPVPGFGAGQLDKTGNLVAFLDRAIFTPAHMWPLGSLEWGGPVVFDPEGLLSTLPAVANVLLGVLAGYVFRSGRARPALIIGVGGIVLFVAGLALDPIFVINKSLWTSSFALLSSGFSAMVLAVLMAVLPVKALSLGMTPMRMLGANAIVAYVIGQLLGRFSELPIAPGGATPQGFTNGVVLSAVGDPLMASLICAVLVLIAVILMIWPLHSRGIHLKL